MNLYRMSLIVLLLGYTISAQGMSSWWGKKQEEVKVVETYSKNYLPDFVEKAKFEDHFDFAWYVVSKQQEQMADQIHEQIKEYSRWAGAVSTISKHVFPLVPGIKFSSISGTIVGEMLKKESKVRGLLFGSGEKGTIIKEGLTLELSEKTESPVKVAQTSGKFCAERLLGQFTEKETKKKMLSIAPSSLHGQIEKLFQSCEKREKEWMNFLGNATVRVFVENGEK